MRTSHGRLLVCLVLLQGTALAESKLTLDQVVAKALAGPKAKMAGADRDMAAARSDEADAARMPRFKATAFGTISPEIHCLDAACDQTSPKNFAFRFSGFFGSAQLDITQPLFTFGKIAHAREAAQAGLDAQRALADETAGDIAVDAARAYWGIKLARELGGMLDDGIEEIENAMKKFNDRTDLSIADRQRVAALLAEAKVQRAEAQQSEEQALAGLRALTGIPDADVDDEPLEALDRAAPATADGSKRPQAIAAAQGAHSYDELAAAAHSQYFPDLALVVSGIVAHAQGADDPPSVFANDPYNRSGVSAVLALQWSFEPWTTKARVARARAEATKAHAQANLAASGATYDAETALAEVNGARARVKAADEGTKATRTWVAAVLQADAIGTAEPKELADSYIAWFQMRARWAMAVMQLDVALTRLDRAQGAFHAH